MVALLATHEVRYHALNPGNDGVLLLDALIIIGGVGSLVGGVIGAMVLLVLRPN